ncbi:hypothetical protein EMPS_03337 [Entomortierella parvispora]|uniref:SURP motif domain-containing protein n=1 Tax=Entomortierella parvispora TaxID=205924 RepID=A0A9P3LUH6_9FUNG|nr:hypothetical protein EMPS_03337 [Entomortierella parvispora]
MWNDPDLDAQRTGQTRPQKKGQARSRRGRHTENEVEEEELIAFGYEAFFFRNDGAAEAIEQGQLMITWQGQDPSDKDAIWLDRYDGRNLLDSERLFTGPREIYDDRILDGDDSELDDERFADLDSDEELLFDMDEDERKEHLEQKRQDKEPSNYTGFGFNYGSEDAESHEPVYQIHFEVPEGMVVPDSQKVLALIERTAKFVNNSSEPTMEIILQAKQATNPNFAFMSRRHPLFQFYKHVRWLMQTGLYETEEEFKQREEDEAKADKEAAEQRALKASRDYRDKEYPHADIEEIIDATIKFLLSSEHTALFEKALNESDDLRFGFLRRSHAWHQHYLERKSEASFDSERSTTQPHVSSEPVDMEEAPIYFLQADLENSHAIPDSPSQLSELEASAKESRAAEMRRLDRLQRIKELFQQKHKKDVTAAQDNASQDPGNPLESNSCPRTGSLSLSRSSSPSPPSSPSLRPDSGSK